VVRQRQSGAGRVWGPQAACGNRIIQRCTRVVTRMDLRRGARQVGIARGGSIDSRPPASVLDSSTKPGNDGGALLLDARFCAASVALLMQGHDG